MNSQFNNLELLKLANFKLQYSNSILDKFMFEDMMSICKSLNDTFAEKYVKATIDLNNVKTLLRVKKQNKADLCYF